MSSLGPVVPGLHQPGAMTFGTWAHPLDRGPCQDHCCTSRRLDVRVLHYRYVRRASARVGSNSSTGLPEGSSITTCLPPTPVTSSFRTWTPAARSRSTMPARSATSTENRFPPSRCWQGAVRHGLPAA
jgi:hypothetical protein